MFKQFVGALACWGLAIPLIGIGATLEPWADSTLPVRDNLELWLDASRENAARRHGSVPMMVEPSSMALWHDASGFRRHFTQKVPDHRPRFLPENGGRITFDGQNDFLSANLNTTFSNLTLFILATPKSNKGGFRALTAVSEMGQHDFTSGLTLDFGFAGTSKFESLNPEGKGFGGATNVLLQPSDFGKPQVITLVLDRSQKKVKTWVNGKPQSARPWNVTTLHAQEMVVGARSFSLSAELPYVQGFFDGDFQQVLLFGRALKESELTEVESFLLSKRLDAPHSGRKTQPLTLASNAAPVQFLVPGFTAQELPVSLKNINNLKYRADGKLVALGYDGQIFLLEDTNGDRLEDKVTTFWGTNSLRAPIGMALTPPGYRLGQGVFVAAKSKLSLVVDTNGDDQADQEIVVAKGWPELPHGVDALGVAIDKDQNIYFGLGTANFTDAYLLDRASDTPRYDLKNERGTILKVSADFQKREILCTGIRFPVALAFNQAGDLFCSDQEGATWLPNGNPFDELLHIEAGRHYGFPPRHPKYLPGVIDEPSVFDYGPQHQSTCGLQFNEGVNGGPVFGPRNWANDALVSGYSRGKLYRTKLVKTPQGYVAQNFLVAALNSLLVETSVSPKGDLVVSTHSGPPDWGFGPTGPGKLYKLFYSNTNAPQPLMAWRQSASEIRIAFDRPLDPAHLKNLAKRVGLTEGKFVSPGDRFEQLRPGYQAVKEQLIEPRFAVDVVSAGLSADARTIIIETASARANHEIAVQLPNPAPPKTSSAPYDEVELAVAPQGVQVVLDEKETFWAPHIDLSLSRQFTEGSADHGRLWTSLARARSVRLRTQLDLSFLLRPSLQPGTKLDYEMEPEKARITFKAAHPFSAALAAAPLQAAAASNGAYSLTLDYQAGPQSITALEIQFAPQQDSFISAFWSTAEDPRPRAFPLRRFLLPWISQEATPLTKKEGVVTPELAGGSWVEGKKLFFSDKTGCYKCHLIRGEGGEIGPDLSNLTHRDYASVLRDIVSPNATINPDHVSYNVTVKDGESFTGLIVKDDSAFLEIKDASGTKTRVDKKQMVSSKPSELSLMPENLLAALSEEEKKHLLTFLLTTPLEPAPIELKNPPAPRSLPEIRALLKSPTKTDAAKTFHVLLVGGPKDHGPGEHDYPLWQKRWTPLLSLAANTVVTQAHGFPSWDQLAKADVAIFYSNNPGWTAEKAKDLDRFFEKGGGVIFIHFAVDGHQAVPELSERIGLAWQGGKSAFRHGALSLKFEKHPISEGIPTLDLVDESYWNLVGDPSKIQLLASGLEGGEPKPLMWTREVGKGRVFVSIPGHFNWTFDDPAFRLILFRGLAWVGRQPLNRFDDLCVIGARVAN